jgi:hypothetical protein
MAPHRTFRVEGGTTAHRARLALLSTPPSPHQPAPLPSPGPAQRLRRAQEARREADGILRHLPAGEAETIHSRFARRQAAELRAEADQIEAELAGVRRG